MVLKFRSMSYAILVILVFNIVGALTMMKLVELKKFSLPLLWKCCVWSYIILLTLLILVCRGPDDQILAYILFVPLGT